jgi:hypothetical protein
VRTAPAGLLLLLCLSPLPPQVPPAASYPQVLWWALLWALLLLWSWRLAWWQQQWCGAGGQAGGRGLVLLATHTMMLPALPAAGGG